MFVKRTIFPTSVLAASKNALFEKLFMEGATTIPIVVPPLSRV
jgi:energy-converting hydrogenase Eha subunit A